VPDRQALPAAFYDGARRWPDGPTVGGAAVRPTTILSLLTGLLLGIVGIVTAILLWTDRTRNYEWFFWAAPLLVFVFGLMMLNLLRQYWRSVGKLEVKGRPRAG
jgi:hypothetical protein